MNSKQYILHQAICCMTFQIANTWFFFFFNSCEKYGSTRPNPQPQWPEPIFNPLKMTRFWLTTRTRPNSPVLPCLVLILFYSLFDQWVIVGWWWRVDDGGYWWCLMIVVDADAWWWWLGGLMMGVDWLLMVA